MAFNAPVTEALALAAEPTAVLDPLHRKARRAYRGVRARALIGQTVLFATRQDFRSVDEVIVLGLSLFSHAQTVTGRALVESTANVCSSMPVSSGNEELREKRSRCQAIPPRSTRSS